MQINRIQSYGSSWVNNRTGVNNHQTQTNPSFHANNVKKLPKLNILDHIKKTIGTLKEYLNFKNLLGLFAIIAAKLGLKTTEETAVSSEQKQAETTVKTQKTIPPTPEQQKQFEAFFKDLEINYEKDKETGLYIIDNYVVNFSNIEKHRKFMQNNNITEDDLFKYIQEIKGNADFEGTKLTSLGNLEKIGGDADFKLSRITSLGNLEKIGGDTDFGYSQITDLGNLGEIGGNIYHDPESMVEQLLKEKGFIV